MNRSVSSPAKCGALSNLLLILPLIIVAGLHQLGTQAAQTVSASGREACPDVWRVEKVERGLDIEGIMRQHQIPGMSIAVIHDFRVACAKGYGVTAKGGSTHVTPTTLFLAGSISKPVAAVGALCLVIRTHRWQRRISGHADDVRRKR